MYVNKFTLYSSTTCIPDQSYNSDSSLYRILCSPLLLITTPSIMSVFRSAALRLPIAPRATLQAVRFNSALANPSLQNYALNDSKIPAGTKAFQIDVPDQLPETDFLKRRKAVEDHAQGELIWPWRRDATVRLMLQPPPTSGGRSGMYTTANWTGKHEVLMTASTSVSQVSLLLPSMSGNSKRSTRPTSNTSCEC